MNTIVSTLSRWAFAPLVYSSLIKEIKGLENVPKKGNFIFASNHLSHLDWFLSGFVCTPRKFTFIGQVDQYTGIKGILRDLLYAYGGVIPINRKNDESKRQAMKTAIEMLKKGYCLVIYPEGTRSRTGQLQQFKPGVGKLHLESGVPILPVAFQGSHELMPPGGKLKLKRIVKLAIGSLMDFSDLKERAKGLDHSSDEYRALCADIAKAVENRVRLLIQEII